MSSPNTSPPKRRGRPPKVKEAPAPAPQLQGEVVVSIPLTELHPFPNHPFKVRDDEAMKETIESEQATPSVSQAQRMKKLSQSGELNEDTMLSIMSAEKKPEVDKIVLTGDTLRKYFPRSYTPRKMEETIIKLLEAWQKKRQRSQER